MKVLVKTLKGQKFNIQVEETDTIGKFKSLIEAQESLSADSLKIIFAGKILKDDQTCQSANIKDNDFVVCMVSRPKKKKTKPAAPAPAPAPAPAAAPAGAAAVTATTPAPAPTPTPVATSPAPAPAPAPAPSAGGSSDLMSGSALEAAVKQLSTGMGFPEDQVRTAMRLAFNNADRAAEYLLNGLPQSGTTPAAPTTTGGSTSTPAPAPAPAGPDPLATWRNHPAIPRLRALVQQNPSQLPQILEQIGRSDPEMLRLIRDHREEFVKLLNTPGGAVPEQHMNPQDMAKQLMAAPASDRTALASRLQVDESHLTGLLTHMQHIPPRALMMLLRLGTQPPQQQQQQQRIALSPEDQASIARLVEMGFPRNRAIEAYLACDKKEEVAANFLFDNPP